MDKPCAVAELYNLYIYIFPNPYFGLHFIKFYQEKKKKFFVMFHVHVYNSSQKVFEFYKKKKKKKKKLHTFIISESTEFLLGSI